MEFDTLIEFVIVAILIAILVYFVITLIRIIRNCIFISKIDRYSDKLKILNLNYNTITRLTICLCGVFVNNILLHYRLLNTSEAIVKDAFYEIRSYYFFIISITFIFVLLLILEFVPSVISSEYLYDNLIKRYHNSEITYATYENQVILYHEDIVILKLRKKKNNNKAIRKIIEIYRLKE